MEFILGVNRRNQSVNYPGPTAPSSSFRSVLMGPSEGCHYIQITIPMSRLLAAVNNPLPFSHKELPFSDLPCDQIAINLTEINYLETFVCIPFDVLPQTPIPRWHAQQFGEGEKLHHCLPSGVKSWFLFFCAIVDQPNASILKCVIAIARAGSICRPNVNRSIRFPLAVRTQGDKIEWAFNGMTACIIIIIISWWQR